MMTIAIVHCPRNAERVANVARLLRALPRARIIEDPGDGVRTMRGIRKGCWPLARRAWEAFDPIATHHVVLEDDAVLCDGFEERLDESRTAEPEAVLSLFRGRRDCSIATVMPTFLIPTFLAWAKDAPHGERWLPHHSFIISQATKELGLRRLYTSPSLVEHGRLPSLLDHDHVSAFRFELAPSSVTLEV